MDSACSRVSNSMPAAPAAVHGGIEDRSKRALSARMAPGTPSPKHTVGARCGDECTSACARTPVTSESPVIRE